MLLRGLTLCLVKVIQPVDRCCFGSHPALQSLTAIVLQAMLRSIHTPRPKRCPKPHILRMERAKAVPQPTIREPASVDEPFWRRFRSAGMLGRRGAAVNRPCSREDAGSKPDGVFSPSGSLHHSERSEGYFLVEHSSPSLRMTTRRMARPWPPILSRLRKVSAVIHRRAEADGETTLCVRDLDRDLLDLAIDDPERPDDRLLRVLERANEVDSIRIIGE